MHRNPCSRAMRVLAIMMVAWAMLLLASLLPRADLATTFAARLCRLSSTAGVTGAILIGLVLVGLLAFRTTPSWRCGLQEVLIHVAVLAVLLGGGALANEYLIKDSLAVHRPNIVRLAEEDALGMTAEQFYSSMDRRERQGYLYQVLTDPGFDAIALTAQGARSLDTRDRVLVAFRAYVRCDAAGHLLPCSGSRVHGGASPLGLLPAALLERVGCLVAGVARSSSSRGRGVGRTVGHAAGRGGRLAVLSTVAQSQVANRSWNDPSSAGMTSSQNPGRWRCKTQHPSIDREEAREGIAPLLT